MPFISDAVTLKYNKKRGRHLIANRNIPTGEVLLVEKSLCFYPDLERIYMICSHCSKQTWNSLPCEHCTLCLYCSINCKKKAWKKYHDIECSLYPKLLTIPCHRNFFLLWRLFITALKEKGVDKIIEEAANQNCCIQTQMGNLKFINVDLLTQ